MQCINCNREIPDNSLFCNWCGKKQIKEKAAKSEIRVPQPRILPSGKAFIQLRIDGQSISITEDTPALCKAKAQAIKAGVIKKQRNSEHITLKQALDKYISNNIGVLSPSTIYSYQKKSRNCLQELMTLKLSQITQQKVQKAVSNMALTASPKYVADAYSLVHTVLALNDIYFKIHLPQKEKYDYAIPTTDDLKAIIHGVQNTPIELPVMLAVWCGLRMSEIRGLKPEDIHGNIMYVRRAIVDVDGKAVEKQTKTTSSTRKIVISEYITELIEKNKTGSPYLVTLSGQAIYKRFKRLCAELNLSQSYRFHDLRHAQASVGLALGVPNKYMQERMGHATDNMLKNVYQHTMPEKADEFTEKIDDYFKRLL